MNKPCLLPDVDWTPVVQRLNTATCVHLVTHRMPDSDGIGSQIALFHALNSMGLDVRMYNADPVPRICRYLDGAELIAHGNAPPAADVVIALDAGAAARLSFSFPDHCCLVNIDHHASNNGYGHINMIDARYPATGAMVYDLLLALKAPWSPAIAQAVYAAILTDTNAFRTETVTADLHRLVAALIDAGAQPALAAQHAYASHQPARFVLLRKALDTLEIHDNGRSAWMHLTQTMLGQSHCRLEDSEGFIEYASSIDGVHVSVLLCQMGSDEWKVTFRGKGACNVGDLATRLGGGGHRHAAGCTLHGSYREVRQRLRQSVGALLGSCGE